MATSARDSPEPIRILASRDPNRMARLQTVEYTPVNDILNGKIRQGQMVSICGVIKDSQLPIKSRGADYKMTIRLADKASEESCSTIALHLFAKSEGDMLPVGALDVVYIHKAKVQTYGGGFSLLSGDASTIFSYSSAVLSLPNPCTAGQSITTWTRARGRQSMPVPDNDMTTGAVALFKHMSEVSGNDLDAVVEEFKIQVARTKNIRDKRTTLKNVRASNYHDLLVRVVTEPRHFRDDLAMMWVSDYTVNDEFKKQGTVGLFADFDSAASGSPTGTTVGDEHGYLDNYTAGSGGRAQSNGKKKTDVNADAIWTGPIGRRSMLVSCFDEHARAIRDEVRRGSWVKLANVHITLGRQSHFLEGFLRSDPDAFGHKLSVEVLDMENLDHKTMDPMHLEAIKQQDRYEKTKAKFIKEQKKRQQKQQKQQQHASNKRKGVASEGDTAENSRQRRRRHRMQREGGHGGSEAGSADRDEPQQAASEMLNRAIVCEAGGQPETPLADVLQPALYASLGQTTPSNDGIVLPFANLKFRAKVRVVDFMPNRLADFAVGRWVSTYELTGYGKDDDIASEDDDDLSSEDDGSVAFGADPRGGPDSSYTFVWEWRFALLLEDASDPGADADADADAVADGHPAAEKPRIWAVVSNADAQQLTAMDACDLRKSKSALEILRQKMFLLWGNLEENKEEEARRAAQAEHARREKVKRAHEEAARKERERVQREKEAEAAKEASEKAREAREAQKAQRQRSREIALQTGGNIKAYPPDASSDIESEDDEPRQRQPSQPDQTPAPQPAPAEAQPPRPIPPLSNRPFVCCIRQFGIWARAEDSTGCTGRTDDDAMSDSDFSSDDEQSQKREWRQMFSMYGTSIRG